VSGLLSTEVVIFLFYDTVKPVVLGKDAGMLSSFALGYAVTVLTGLCSYSIDTIRRRMMMSSGETA